MTQEIGFLDGNNGYTNKIKQAMYRTAKELCYIGFLLIEVMEYGYYTEHNYKSVFEYAEEELGFKKTTTKNMMNICKTFTKTEKKEIGNGSYISGKEYGMNIATEYEKFNYSQLCEMLSMTPAQKKLVMPNMTVKQIREIKKKPSFEYCEAYKSRSSCKGCCYEKNNSCPYERPTSQTSENATPEPEQEEKEEKSQTSDQREKSLTIAQWKYIRGLIEDDIEKLKDYIEEAKRETTEDSSEDTDDSAEFYLNSLKGEMKVARETICIVTKYAR